MTTLSTVEVARLSRQAGFVGAALVTAVAVAHAESGFNDAAVGDVDLTEPGERSVGLWQINWRPSRDVLGGIRDPNLNLAPMHNAVAAFSISGRGKSFGPWSTFTSGAYSEFLSEAKVAVAQLEEVGMTAKIVGGIPCAAGGFWLFTDDGAVYSFGGAPYVGRLILDPTGLWIADIPK